MPEVTARQREELESETKGAEMLHPLSKPDVQEALMAIVADLPKLAEMTTVLTKTYDLAKQTAGDRVLVQDMIGGIKEVLEPIEKKAKHCALVAVEARVRAGKRSVSAIGLSGMLKMLKDPEMQRLLRFGRAYLEIMSERRN